MAARTMAYLALIQNPLEKKEQALLWLANGKRRAFFSRSLVHIQNQHIVVAAAEMLLSEDQSMACIE